MSEEKDQAKMLKPKAEKGIILLAGVDILSSLAKNRPTGFDNESEDSPDTPQSEHGVADSLTNQQDMKHTIQKHYWTKEEVL